MDSLKINEDVCRICLKQSIKLNWNNEMMDCNGISYKDCYYKYTQLEEPDSDCYPKGFCQMCAIGLESAHMLFEKALESLNFLRSVLRTKEFETSYEISALDEVCFSPVYYCEAIEEQSNELSDFEEELVVEDVTVEPTHFIDIQHVETFDEIPLEDHLSEISNSELKQQFDKSCDTNLSNSLTVTETIGKNIKCASLTNPSLEKEFNSSYNGKLLEQFPRKRTVRKRKKIKSSQQNVNEDCEANPVLPATNTIKAKDRVYMCSYCSLKIKGPSNFARHEATHNENRKRTQICPQCGLKLYTKNSLTEHLKTHDKKRQKKHECEFCGKAFYNRGSLNVHRRKHLGLMVKCRLCTKEFFRQIDLDKHLVKHSASPLQRNVTQNKYVVQCQYCNKPISTTCWKDHLAAHLDEPQVKCKICDKNYYSRHTCIKHLRQYHHKKSCEYENCIHYYTYPKPRVSNLIMKQQLDVRPCTENLQDTEVQ